MSDVLIDRRGKWLRCRWCGRWWRHLRTGAPPYCCSHECTLKWRHFKRYGVPADACGCGRDYLEVPLEDSHVCERLAGRRFTDN